MIAKWAKSIGLLFTITLTGAVSADDEVWVWTKIEETEQLRELMTEHSNLKDPFSVQFRNTYQRDIEELGNTAWCGELNSKNSMGAYVGWHRFYAIWAPKKTFFSFDVEGSGMFEREESNAVIFQFKFETFCKDIP